MCGIFSLLNPPFDNTNAIVKHFEKGKGRGPEHSQLMNAGIKITMGFHRLAINGLNIESSQPFIRGGLSLICNGEIYNYRKLYEIMGVTPETQSDCEVILWLYEKYGIEQCLKMLDGVFAFVLLDQRLNYGESRVYVARDPYGVRPLYKMKTISNTHSSREDQTIGFASELKMLSGIFPENQTTIEQFTPGTWSMYKLPIKVHAQWVVDKSNVPYTTTAFAEFPPNDVANDYADEILKNIRHFLTDAVEKRCCTTERPIACLLSGGLDSSLITALVSQYHKKNGLPPIETYSIGLEGSVDLYYAKRVADYLGTNHTEIVLTEQDFCDALHEVICAIESYDTTSVRASIGNYLLGKYIAAHSEAKVIFNGDGSDELLGGYLYMKHAPDALEFDKECRRLLTDIHAFDVLRSDKSISTHGLEPRTPFLDRAWTQYILSLPCEVRFQPSAMEKYWLRHAFNNAILPNEVLWRKKEAFSDGVSDTSRSLYQILQEYAADKLVGVDISLAPWTHNPPQTLEQYYYRSIFDAAYPGQGKIVPYMWMPKYVEAKDASARTLAIYGGDDQV
jgi:asparagine synthase (glutamine-hydrolysing)